MSSACTRLRGTETDPIWHLRIPFQHRHIFTELGRITNEMEEQALCGQQVEEMEPAIRWAWRGPWRRSSRRAAELAWESAWEVGGVERGGCSCWRK